MLVSVRSQYRTCSEEKARPLFPQNLITADLLLMFNWVLVALTFPSLLSSCHTLESDVTFDRKASCILSSETGLKQHKSCLCLF